MPGRAWSQCPPQQPPLAPPHWQGAPDWQPHPQPGPQPHPAATTGSSLAALGAAWSDGWVVEVGIAFIALKPSSSGRTEGTPTTRVKPGP
ncbi:hypothetical protein GCM10023235_35280 [Kitasatospora terrestris]|uniref:Uncharacterized protein n=1 Tax=Kitasatospora terrestris TaxID=258051 RepID=A0ABP9DVX3_9ACTN